MQQKNSYVPPGEGGDTRGNEFTLDPDSVTEDTDGGRGSELTTPTDTPPLLYWFYVSISSLHNHYSL